MVIFMILDIFYFGFYFVRIQLECAAPGSAAAGRFQGARCVSKLPSEFRGEKREKNKNEIIHNMVLNSVCL